MPLTLSEKFAPERNRPTIGALAVAFLTSLIHWGWEHIPDSVPAEVRSTGLALALAAVAIAVGKVVERFGDHAPWADTTHRAAVAYALSLDPERRRAEVDTVLGQLGIDGLDEARRLIGLPAGEPFYDEPAA